MSNYETVMIARQDVSAAQADTLADQFVGLLTADGGEIARREYWGLRSLAFRIKKNRKGHYLLLNYTAPATAVAEMERNMRLSEDVLRYMTVRTDDLPTDASVIMARKDERSERPARSGDRYERGESKTNKAEEGAFVAAIEEDEIEIRKIEEVKEVKEVEEIEVASVVATKEGAE